MGAGTSWACRRRTPACCVTASLLSLAFVAAAGGATRGTLTHWVTLHAGKISTYQVMIPTTWNAWSASARDTHAVPGHFEQSLVGLPADESSGPRRS